VHCLALKLLTRHRHRQVVRRHVRGLGYRHSQVFVLDMVPYLAKAARLWFGHIVIRLLEKVLGQPVQSTEPPSCRSSRILFVLASSRRSARAFGTRPVSRGYPASCKRSRRSRFCRKESRKSCRRFWPFRSINRAMAGVRTPEEAHLCPKSGALSPSNLHTTTSAPTRILASFGRRSSRMCRAHRAGQRETQAPLSRRRLQSTGLGRSMD
jgi:hypothetical protein